MVFTKTFSIFFSLVKNKKKILPLPGALFAIHRKRRGCACVNARATMLPLVMHHKTRLEPGSRPDAPRRPASTPSRARCRDESLSCCRYCAHRPTGWPCGSRHHPHKIQNLESFKGFTLTVRYRGDCHVGFSVWLSQHLGGVFPDGWWLG